MPRKQSSARARSETDFIVIGSGVAGLRAALELARCGWVLMLTKGQPFESSSIYAQGGVAVALSEEDDVAVHLRDTLKAGHGLCRREAVRVLVEEGPRRIHELIRWGLSLTRSAMHSLLRGKRRTAGAGFFVPEAMRPEMKSFAF